METDLTEDYSEAAIAMSDAAKDAAKAKGKELGLEDQELIHEFVMAIMRMYVRTIAAAYSAAANRENVEVLTATLMTATHQRIVAQIIDNQLKSGKPL